MFAALSACSVVFIKQAEVIIDVSSFNSRSANQLLLAQTINPFITYFVANPSSLQSGYTAVFSWQAAGANGANFYFDCPTGITVKDTNGSAISCGSAVSTGNYTSGSSAYTFYNVSGITRTINVRLVPKDANGAENTEGSSNLALNISATVQPITDFSTSVLNPQSGEEITLSWTGVYISGINLQFDCSSNLKFFTGDSAKSLIMCGVPAFSEDLPTSGTYTMTIENDSYSAVPVRVIALPSQGGGLYDSTKSLSLKLTVQGKLTPTTPKVSSFTSSKTITYSGENLSLKWDIDNAEGANLQFQCNRALSVSAVNGTTTTALPCGTLAFGEALSKSGSTTISIKSSSAVSEYLTVSLLPMRSDNTYTTLGASSLAIRVASGSAPPVNTQVKTQSAVTQQTASATAVTAKNSFTLSMEIGSENSQVRALQEFLAKNKTIYPEGITSGYFGALTELAVKRFQVKYDVADPGDPGYGYVGPKTRALLNSLTEP